MSSRSVRSSPMCAISPQPQGNWILSGSISRSNLGRCSGRWLRYASGHFVRGADARFAGAASSASALPHIWNNRRRPRRIHVQRFATAKFDSAWDNPDTSVGQVRRSGAMSYALSVLAFFATIIGVVGNTWKDGKPTVVGWIAIVLACAALALLLVQNYERDKERKMLGDLACEQVLRGTFGLLTPFAVLLANADLEKKVPGTGPTQLNSRIFEYLNMPNDSLDSHVMDIFPDLPSLLDHTDSLDTYSLQSYVRVLNGNRRVTWKSLFETTAIKGIAELDAALSFYSSVMDVETIDATQHLRTVWLTQRIENLPTVDISMKLSEFLHLDQKEEKHDSLTIFEQFVQASKRTSALCSGRNDG